jgi:hypothetical protein
VAARAGCEITGVEVDRNGIDGTIRAIKGTRVKIDVQLKATSSAEVDATNVKFDLDVGTYNDLRSTHILAPQLLVVLVLPPNADEWLAADEQSLAFKSRPRKSAQDDKWNFCLTAGTLWPANQERS